MVDEEATTPSTDLPANIPEPEFSRNYPDWTDEEIIASEMLIQDMMEYYPAYSLSHGVEFRENPEGAYYHNRNNEETPPGQPLIEIHPDRKVTSMAHELGHDVLVQHLPDVRGSRVVYSTFKELFADLNSLHFTEAEPDNRELNRNPNKDLSVYSGVSDLLDAEHWEEGVMRVDRILDRLETENWDTIQTDAKILAASEPQAANVLDVRDFPYERAGAKNYLEKLSDNPEVSHMFYDNFFGTHDYSPVTEVAETTHDIWSMAQVLGNTDAMPPRYPVEEAREDHSRIWGKMAGAATVLDDCSLDEIEQESERVLLQALETDLWDTRENMEEVRDNLQSVGDPHYFVRNSISGQKYGKPYDTSIDYPHNIGGYLAEQFYLKGAEPMDVIEEPQKYLQASSRAIDRHIKDNI